MAETKVVEQKENNSAGQNVPRYYLIPRYGMRYEDGKYILQIALPGVAKDQIKIKTLEDFFELRATRNELGYALDLDFNFKIEQGKTKAEYKEGLLKIEFTVFNPLDHAFMVPIE